MSMFMRFGFYGTNNIDNLLGQDEVSLESVLDHDDLLSECKQQNPRLIDYLQHPEVLQRLFAYVTGEIVSEGRQSFKYPYVSAEVLCCEIWAIVERCTDNAAQILAPFWETVLSTPPDELRTKVSVASHFSKISAVFIAKKPNEMLTFIKSIPNVVDRMLGHIEAPPFVDLLFRIIQLDDTPGNIGVMDWLSSQNFMQNLVDRLSPRYPPSVHLVVADLLKGIISVASPSPGSFNVNGTHDGGPTGPITNRFVRELASTAIVETMVGFMLDEVPFGRPIEETLAAADEKQKAKAGSERTLVVPSGLPGASDAQVSQVDPTSEYLEKPPLPNAESASSSLTQIVSIFVELIRKNNSDYFEPYLFHTLRNRLMQMQQQHLDEMHELGADMDSAQRVQEARDMLEQGMADMVDHLGIVHLGRFLRILSNRLPDFQRLLHRPRSLAGYIPTSVGDLVPLTLERFRIIELYAELIHCSNMPLLNRRRGFGPSYDEHGRLMGGLDALEQLARVIDPNVTSDAMMDQSIDSDTPHDPRDAQVSSASTGSSIISDDGVGVDDEHGELDDPQGDSTITKPISRTSSDQGNSTLPAPSDATDPFSDPEPSTGSSDISAPGTEASSSNTSTIRQSPMEEHFSSVPFERSGFEPSGDIFKQKMIDISMVSTILDFFFDFPWNNFLHNAVYDILHQILTGRVDSELSRRVTIGMFRDSRLVHRILDGSMRNDSAQRRGLRLGYMGHLILISDDIVDALEHYPHSLLEALTPYVPQPDWNNFVAGQYKETKERDSSQLGGGRPSVPAGLAGMGRGAPMASMANRFGDTPNPRIEAGTGRGIGPVPREVRGGADFGPPEPNDTLIPSEPDQVSRFVSEQTQSSRFEAGSSSDEDEDLDAAWVSTHSASGDFDLNAAHAPAGRAANDSFESTNRFSTSFSSDDDDDDPAWSPFSDSAASSTGRSSLPSNFSNLEFGDDDDDGFGDFQGSTENLDSSFEDSFDGFTSAPSNSNKDDTMEEPTTPKASARKLSSSSSFESIEDPDQEESWSSVWSSPTPAPTDDAGAAAPDAVADAMTSHIGSS